MFSIMLKMENNKFFYYDKVFYHDMKVGKRSWFYHANINHAFIMIQTNHVLLSSYNMVISFVFCYDKTFVLYHDNT